MQHFRETEDWICSHLAKSDYARLGRDFDVSEFENMSCIIVEALQTHGMIVVDNGTSSFISGVTDLRWDDEDLN